MGVTDNLLHSQSARVISSGSGSHSEVRSGDLPMENGHYASRGGPKYKQRRVSAVRDFPPGCGRFAVRLNGRANDLDIVQTTSPGAENITHSSNHIDRSELMNVDVQGSLFPKTGNVTASDQKSSGTEENLNAVDIAALKKAMTRNYPPRRRVSAIRDFPRFCGRNAPPLITEEKCRKPLASLSNLDEETTGAEDKPFKESMIDGKLMGDDVYDGEASKMKLECGILGITSGDIQAECEGSITLATKKPEEIETSENVMKVPSEDTSRKSAESVCESKQLIESSNNDVGVMEGNLVRDIVVYAGNKQLDGNCSELRESNNQLQEGDFEALGLSPKLVDAQSLMELPYCTQRQEKGSGKTGIAGGSGESKTKKHKVFLRKSAFKNRNEAESSGGSVKKKNISPSRNASEGMGQLVTRIVEDAHVPEDNDFTVGQRSHTFNVSLPPSCPGGKGLDSDATGSRNKVRETLRLFQAVCRKLLQEEEAKSSEQSIRKRIDIQAAKILKDKGKNVNVGKQIIGPVPGVEVGDEFQYRVELNIIGLHRQTQGGIDYVRHNGKILCTSIVASGGYDDVLDNSDILTYTGQGGNVMKCKKEPEDQKLERGNLSLVNSLHEKNPVRVIRGESKGTDAARIYVYDGLYLVEKYWQDVGTHGKLVFKFRLVRIPGQPELGWKLVKKCKKFKVREGLCNEDISQGKELIPICAVNTIDDEKPPKFNYVTRMMYPDWLQPAPPKGCDCTKKCMESGKCSCTAKNGGEIPYNHNGAIVETKPLVYECGPACQCPLSCYNRVTQNGIKFQLEIFKTESRGWGVRSLNSIPAGSFICEYAGELLEEKEAEMRTGNDEYLFDIGNNYSDDFLKDGLSSVMPDSHSNSCEVVEDGGFTIDAAQYGNVGRFVNHSCSPNLYAQNVLYDHDDKRIPHIMFFAAENIPPLQELTYHYNYMIDQVRDSNGNIKRKSCYCGSSECTGRLY